MTTTQIGCGQAGAGDAGAGLPPGVFHVVAADADLRSTSTSVFVAGKVTTLCGQTVAKSTLPASAFDVDEDGDPRYCQECAAEATKWVHTAVAEMGR